jgi:hypothetical protein
VRTKPIGCFGAHVDALHWWTDQLRSNLTFGIMHEDIAWNLVAGTNCISTGGAPGSAQNNCGVSAGASGGNKQLMLANLNLIWSPVSFVDVGLEYTFGQRQTLINTRGDAYVVSGMLKVKF